MDPLVDLMAAPVLWRHHLQKTHRFFLSYQGGWVDNHPAPEKYAPVKLEDIFQFGAKDWIISPG